MPLFGSCVALLTSFKYWQLASKSKCACDEAWNNELWVLKAGSLMPKEMRSVRWRWVSGEDRSRILWVCYEYPCLIYEYPCLIYCGNTSMKDFYLISFFLVADNEDKTTWNGVSINWEEQEPQLLVWWKKISDTIDVGNLLLQKK